MLQLSVKKQLFQFTLSNPLAQLNLERYQLAYRQEVDLPETVYRMDRVYSKIDSASVLEWIDQMRDIANYPHIQDEGAVAVAVVDNLGSQCGTYAAHI